MPIVTTWNLLHRIHAENWREPATGARLDEAPAARLLGWVAEGRIVACQDVGGDVLAALRRGLPAGASLWSFCYPRVPRLRVDGGAGPLDPSERLVTVAGPGLAGREVAAEAFATDSGKGLLVVDVAGLRVINTHVSHGERRGRQLAQLAARAGEGPAALLGDFNARR
ncbi:MAG TPA: endonuclease/exonuclease/phosphatase family protein, partial [Myxococcota bacterium]|nr:endonuclease/exonuclease/phosphatase family protein [Myxococcota bacterium]